MEDTQMLSRRIMRLLIASALLAMTAGLAQAESGQLTAASHGIELPAGLAERIPFPIQAEVGGQREIVGTYYINFQFSLAWPEALEFFAAGLPAAGWEITSEDLPEQATGPRSATWRASGHDAELSLNLQTAGDAQGSHSVGVLQIRPARR
jgi:hypothetical protein